MAQLFIINPYFRGIVIHIWENDVIPRGNDVIPRVEYHSFVFWLILDFEFDLTCYKLLLDHSVNVSQSRRCSLFRVKLTADASFLLQINHLDRRINICAATVKTIYTTSAVKYRYNTDFSFRYWLSAFCVLKSAWHLC